MVGWKSVMSAAEIDGVRQYVIKRAHEDKALEGNTKK
jgi:alcohol dehydrogenase (cytochrome c)/quinohemoprotein ethanol dehydrogenase